MIIEIKGVQFVNKGAELMLFAVLAKVAEYWPEAEVALAPNPNATYQQRAKVGALQKFSLRKGRFDINAFSALVPRRLRRFLRGYFGIVFECDIDLVLDASGFGYGDAWGTLKSRQLARELRRFAKRGKHYVFLPQAFGPFEQVGHRRYLASYLSRASLICAREHASAAYIESLLGSKPGNLQVYPDFTNLVVGEVPDYFSSLGTQKEIVLIIPNHAMLGERNQQRAAWKATYMDVMKQAIAAAQAFGYEAVLLNHEGESDRTLCVTLNAHFQDTLRVIEESSPLAVKGMIGASKAVVCSRFHGCVSALSQGVPCLGTSWSHKYEALFADYERSKYLLEPAVTPGELSALLESAILSREDADYQHAIKGIKGEAEAMWQQVRAHVS